MRGLGGEDGLGVRETIGRSWLSPPSAPTGSLCSAFGKGPLIFSSLHISRYRFYRRQEMWPVPFNHVV